MAKQPLTMEQIQELSDEELLGQFDSKDRKVFSALAKAGLGDPKPPKRDDETTAQYIVRSREAEEVYKDELARSLRKTFETQLYASKPQKEARFRAMMNQPLPPEEKERLAKAEDYRKKRDELSDKEWGTPAGIVSPIVAPWGEGGDGNKLK